MLAFLLFDTPFLIPLIKKLTTKHCVVIIIALTFIDSYMQIITHIMEYSTIYSNIIYRCIEFIIGICLVKIYSIVSSISNKKLHIISIVIMLSFILGIDILSRIGGNYLDYGFFAIPIFMLLILSSSNLEYHNFFAKIIKGKILTYFNAIAYEFFLAQFFCFKITNKLIILHHNVDFIKVVISFIICLVTAILLHEIVTNPIKRFLVNFRFRI